MTNLATLLLIEKYENRFQIYKRFFEEQDLTVADNQYYLSNKLLSAMNRLSCLEFTEQVLTVLEKYENLFVDFLKKLEK